MSHDYRVRPWLVPSLYAATAIAAGFVAKRGNSADQFQPVTTNQVVSVREKGRMCA
jgi:hypothetical protein